MTTATSAAAAATASSTREATSSSEAVEVVGAHQRSLERHREEVSGAAAIRLRAFTSQEPPLRLRDSIQHALNKSHRGTGSSYIQYRLYR